MFRTAGTGISSGLGWQMVAAALAALTILPAAAWSAPTEGGPDLATSPPATGPATGEGDGPARYVPPVWSAAPFVALLLAIAVLPLAPACAGFWHHNRNKLLVGLALSAPVLLYYYFQHPSLVVVEDGRARELAAGGQVLRHVLAGAVLEAFVPFIVLLFALYTISGGIELRGDLRAHPLTNTTFLGVGAVLASLVGTTGAAMLLIRPLLRTNAERKHVRHTVVFFIFLVCNIGGCLLPTGDPPLFLGYLMGVPFLWTLRLAAPWAFCTGILLAAYYVWDCLAYRKELPQDIARDESIVQPLRLVGKVNLLYLLAVVLAAGLLTPGKPFVLLRSFVIPHHLREAVMLALAGLSLLTTPRGVRRANQFTFGPIAEVAALFLGIFITMQAPIEILRVRGPALGLTEPWQFFWATGGLSSFLDNAPTYVVFFETADSLTRGPGAGVMTLFNGQHIRVDLLAAVSLGAVFMGANTYIGNGPNFMVKAIAEQRRINMPGFFGYMLYSLCILIPTFLLVTWAFL